MPSEIKPDAPGWREEERRGEDRDSILRRLKIRCWRRGVKEMDLILGGFIDAAGAQLSDAQLTAFDRLTREDDSVLYAWVSGAAEPADAHAEIIAVLRRHHGV